MFAHTFNTQTLYTSLLRCIASAALVVAFLIPGIAHAGPASGAGDCTTSDGQPGTRIAIALGDTRCIPLQGTSLQTNPIFIYIVGILKVVAGLAGLACVGGFVFGGILYITARANAGQVEKAKEVMINTTIGLFMFIFMYAILQFLVPGGVFTS